LGQLLSVSDTLEARTQVLALCTIGLTYIAVGKTESAISIFQQALNTPGWTERDGKEVIHHFIAAAYKARRAEGDLDLARESYRTAVTLNPNYAPGFLGLGDLHYDGFIRSDHSNQAELSSAIEEYEWARNSIDPATSHTTAAKIHVALGNAYLIKAQLGDEPSFVKAEAEFFSILSGHDAGKAEFGPYLANALYGLGVFHERATGNFTLAAQYYRQSIDAAPGQGSLRQSASDRLRTVEQLLSQV
jgi:tetratricopeptide (TPR) repeat protein